MFQAIRDRLREPSTYAGLAAISIAADATNIINWGNDAAQVAAATGAQVAGGNWFGAALTFIFGALAIAKREKKN